MFYFIRKYRDLAGNELWSRMSSFVMILFFLFISNAILSFWVPNLLEDIFGDPAKMGLIISFSSLIGFIADLTLKKILRGITVKALVLWAILGSLIFCALLLLGIKFPFLFIFLLAMGVWGIYYEFMMFSEQQFISDEIPIRSHSSSWALLDIFKNLGYLLGPFLAGYLVLYGQTASAYGAIFFSIISLTLLFVSKKAHKRPVEIDFKEVNIFREVQHWAVLFKSVWPVVTLSIFLGLIDATFWTTGAIWTETLAKENFMGIFLIPAYQMPPLFMGFVIARWGVVNGKKKIALHYFLLASAFLTLLGFTKLIPLQILMVLISSIMLSVTYPMLEAVYSNILARMGQERKHLMGLSNSAGSLSYIVGPAICGYITAWVGEQMTFAIMGGMGILVALFLLIVTPRKIKLPQAEMNTWSD